MAKWTLISREDFSDEHDLVTYRIQYSTRTIINSYLFKKGETWVPKRLLKSRKYSTQAEDGKKWVEGKVKGRSRRIRR